MIGPHPFSDDADTVAYSVCPRCGASRAGAMLGLESPWPGVCRAYATTWRYFKAYGGTAEALRRALRRPAVALQGTLESEGRP